MKKILIPMIFAVLVAKSQTSIPPGYVSGIWNLAGSPYLIQGSIQVPNNSTLIIEPGVTVNFQGHYKLMVLGRLLANGNITDSIFFTASNTTSGWYGIRFDNTPSTNDSSFFSYCNIQWGKATGTINDAYGGALMFNNFSKVSVANCLIKNCSSVGLFGGGIYCNNSNPIISKNSITNCIGGIYFEQSNPEITYNNISFNNGNGIRGSGNGNGLVNIQHNTISNNTSTGIFVKKANITNNIISYNSSAYFGGGIRIDNMDESIISHNIISYNTSTSGGYGGGIDCYICKATISFNKISNNSAINGAGIGFMGGGNYSPIVSNNTIVNNTSDGTTGYGGGIYINGASTPIITNNTIANNSAKNGGGIYFTQSTSPSISNTILYGNLATISGNQVYISDESSDPSFYYCDLESGPTGFELNGNFYSGTYSNNIDLDPLFFSSSSGSGITFDGVNSDWSLQSNSPCINTGNPTGTYPTIDIAGNPRIYGATIDIGAYEFQGSVGVNSYNLENQFYFFPNPASTQLSINTELAISEITIIDITGKTIMTTKHHTNVINVADLSNGIYFLILITDKGTITKKFVKQ